MGFVAFLFGRGCARVLPGIDDLVDVHPPHPGIAEDKGPENEHFPHEDQREGYGRHLGHIERECSRGQYQKAQCIGDEHGIEEVAGLAFKVEPADGASFVHGQK